MEDTRHVKLYTFLITMGIFFIFPLFVSAYSDRTTHPALTDETVKYFNSFYGENTLSDTEKELVIQGSIDEDDGIRWMRHFYDPVHDRGLILGQEWQKSKEWAQDTTRQAGIVDGTFAGSLKSFFGGDSDFSWERAIYEYAWGDKERALLTLGHTIHLIQDATVPDHTRNDAHPPLLDMGSPYENWTAQFDRNTINVDTEGEWPVVLGTLDEYFDSVANYSNNNFFSNDTIFVDEYLVPTISFLKKEKLSNGLTNTFGYQKYDGNLYKLVRLDSNFDWRNIISVNDIDKKYFITDDDNLILTDYWNLLSKQAVLHGAGVMQLFFNEVEKEKKSKVLYKKNRNWFKRAYDATVGDIFDVTASLYGSSVSYETLNELTGGASAPVAFENISPKPELPVETKTLPEIVTEIVTEIVVRPEVTEPATLIESVSEAEVVTEVVSTVVVTELDTQNTSTEVGLGTVSPMTTNVPYPGFGGGGGSRSSASTQTDSVVEVVEEEIATTTATTTNSTPEPSVPSDTTAPDVTLSSATCSDSFGVSTCVTSTTAFQFAWSSSASDFSYFVLDQGGVVSTTTATSTSVTIPADSSYVFNVSAFDETGNSSATSTLTVSHASLPVVINEIAWMGTGASSADEWIELYNNTDKDISLNDWVLYAQDGVPYIPLGGIISAGSYYLIERTDDTTVSDVTADLVVPFSGNGSGSGLSNNGEHLFLVRSGTDIRATSTVDEVPRCNFKWCGGLSNTYTMEKYDSHIVGTDTSNWGTSIGNFVINGLDANNFTLRGTPGKRNSVNYTFALGGVLSTDKTLTKANSPYLIPSEGFIIQEGKKLTLNEGVVVKIVSPQEPTFTIKGALVTQGTENEPVIFTSFTDDTYGGDMNSDGACSPNNASSTAACPSVGDWKQILFTPQSTGSSLIHTTIRYGGKWFNNMSMKSAVAVDQSDITLDNMLVEYSNRHGIIFSSAESTTTNSTFKNNTAIYDATGARVIGGSAFVENSTFKDNKYGLYVSGTSDVTVQSNTFTNNSSEAISSVGALGSFESNNGSGNGLNAIILEGTLTTVGTTTVYANTLPYLLRGQTYVSASSTLAFENGVVVKGDDTNPQGELVIQNGGRIFSGGTAPTDLIFTSIDDDTVSVDVSGASTTAQKGDWKGITIKNGGEAHMSGFSTFFADNAFDITNAVAQLENVLFRDNKTDIQQTASSTVICTSCTMSE